VPLEIMEVHVGCSPIKEVRELGSNRRIRRHLAKLPNENSRLISVKS